MSRRIVVDPITRIEGHLRVDVVIDDNNTITDAYASGTLFRGIETILKGRDPRDAGFMTQRICGVCTYSHYKAGIEAVENALGIIPPYNAQLVRSLMGIALFMHDHVVHFYHLHGLDWCDITQALAADPRKASDLAFRYADFPVATGADELTAVQARVKTFVDKGHLGPFANAYWGHSTYRFTPEQNLIVLSHYLKALEVQRLAAQMMAVFGAKQPHPQSLTVGGVTCIMDLESPKRLGEFLTRFEQTADFIKRAYYADVKMAAEAYGSEDSVLQGCNIRNFMASSQYPISRTESLFDSGYILDGDLSRVYDIDDEHITEEATHAWYQNNEPLHPYEGKTQPNYTGFQDGDTVNGPAKILDGQGKYSWVKAPRYNGKPMEVGPLAQMLVSYGRGNPRVQKLVNNFLSETGLPVEALFTTLGRTAGRMLQTMLMVEGGHEAFGNLVENLKVDRETCAAYSIDNNREYRGSFSGDVPRGALSHWVTIKNGVIDHYQCVVPSTWNASPRDAQGQPGPYEAALVGTTVADPTQPLEIIRTIHSFDPCLACAIHVMDVEGNCLAEYRVDPQTGQTS
ncbi:nickel-dependent hydrogenase large subunit [Desulfurispira natronophila]|uniref:Quinone-reactive Ni/Fe-hydrogenase large subunit n=1 Tax=Desulfurispira natronophila TaxID=682562 RepID=A0A7W8DHR3_9BACT|nr:nickel-dependent hydrogenase large subunit [Desulfurispira natronophila]MBB5022755.1 quinone-reactive Ni/Fe-hydrogenase large subunit [Desulfurispira natronophila]